MEKEFAPYNESLELKNIGFNEPCFGWYRSTLIPSNFTEYFLETEFGMNESPSDWVNSNFLDKACSAPLYQQAFRWFREKYKFDLTIQHNKKYVAIVYSSVKNFSIDEYETYEIAELECLKKLIEIVKNKKESV